MTSTERFALVDDYMSLHMTDEEAQVFEEELFADAAMGLGEELASVDRAVRLVEFIGARGAFEPPTRATVDAIIRAGVKVHEIDIGKGGPVDIPMWPADVDVVVFRSGVDARGLEDIEVEIETADGRPIKTFRGVTCDPTDGAVYAICEAPLARMSFGRGRCIARVIATRDGKRDTVFVFDTRPQP